MRRFLIAVMFCMLMFITACKKDIDENTTGLYSVVSREVAFSEDGLFYINKDQLVHFISAETKEDMIFCTDPSCEHKPYNATDNPDPTCRAALFGYDTRIAYYDGALYYFVNVSINAHKIYKMQINEAGRKHIADVMGCCRADYGITFYNNHIYYVTDEVIENEEIIRMDHYPRIADVNLTDGSSRLLTPKDESMSGKNYANISVCGNTLLAEKAGEQSSLIKVDLTTLENTVLIPAEEYNNPRIPGYSIIGPCDDEYYYCSKMNSSYTVNTIYKKSILTGAETELVKGNIWNVNGCGDALYYRVDKENNDFESYYYDVKNNKLYNITQNEKKYGKFDFYEGYSKKFFTYVTEKEKDSFPKLYETFSNNRTLNGKATSSIFKDGEWISESYDLLGYAAVDLSEILEGCKAENYKP